MQSDAIPEVHPQSPLGLVYQSVIEKFSSLDGVNTYLIRGPLKRDPDTLRVIAWFDNPDHDAVKDRVDRFGVGWGTIIQWVWDASNERHLLFIDSCFSMSLEQHREEDEFLQDWHSKDTHSEEEMDRLSRSIDIVEWFGDVAHDLEVAAGTRKHFTEQPIDPCKDIPPARKPSFIQKLMRLLNFRLFTL
ncbi:MAG: hypothetical protein GTO63_28945 [Anaerolineae bacterium]|nr:hypothetical protein [Anaerolineae bacterium]NIQ81682.1 hypothetical protein [Anaerolineae bacterium]